MALKRAALCASVIAMFAFVATAQSQSSSSNQNSGSSGQSGQGSSTQAQSNQNASRNNQAQSSGSSNSSSSNADQASSKQGASAQGSASQNSSSQGASNRGSSTASQGTTQTTDRNNTSSSNNSQTQPDRNAQSNSSSKTNSDRNANTSDRSSSRSGTADQRDAVDGQYRGRNSADRSNERNDRNVDNRSDRDRDNNERSYLNRDRSDNDRDRSDGDRSDRSDRSSYNRDRDGGRDREMSRDRDRGNKRGPDIGLWFNRGSRDGLVISDVSSKGPIARFGFREGDRIVSVNGHRVSSEDDFMRYVLHGDSDRVTVIVYRDGREQTIYVEPAVFNEDTEYAEVDPMERFGIILDDRYDDRIVVWRVIPRSPAYYAGFRSGDVITNFGDHPYRTRNEFEHSVTGWKAGDVNVQVRRGENSRQLSVDVPNNLNRSDRVAERQDRRMDRTDRRADRYDHRNNNQQNRGRIGGGILNRGR